MNCEVSMYDYIKESIIDKTNEKIIFYNRKIKADELFSQIDSLAYYLTKIGVELGEAVGICLPNIPQAVISLYAINRIGGVANVIHPKIGVKALLNILEKTKTKVIFLYDKFLANYENALLDKGITIISCSVSEYLKGIKKAVVGIFEPQNNLNIISFRSTIGEKGAIERNFSSKAAAVYLHSSGTTGNPKTVVLSSYAFNMLVDNVVTSTTQNHTYKSSHSMLMVLPLFHGFGLGICIHLSIAKFKVVMMPRFNAKEALQLIKKHKINYLAGIPAMFEKMLAEKSFDGKYLSSLLLIFCGADKLSAETKQNFDKILAKNGSSAEIFEGYGLSEVASVFSVNVKGFSKDGTQGKPIAEAAVRIADVNGKEVKAGVCGEMLLQSQTIMNGYLDEKDKDYIYTDENGGEWLKTGDIGFVDEEGYLTFKEREKRIIKIAGVNIFPSEIEELVCKMKEIDNACVVRTCKEGKPCTKLYIVMNSTFKFSAPIEQRIKSRIAEEFIKYAVPKEIIVAEKLELNMMGKVNYRKYEEIG